MLPEQEQEEQRARSFAHSVEALKLLVLLLVLLHSIRLALQNILGIRRECSEGHRVRSGAHP